MVGGSEDSLIDVMTPPSAGKAAAIAGGTDSQPTTDLVGRLTTGSSVRSRAATDMADGPVSRRADAVADHLARQIQNRCVRLVDQLGFASVA